MPFVSRWWPGCERRVELPASAALRSRSTQLVLQQEGLLQVRPPQRLLLPGDLLHPLRGRARHREGRREGRGRLPVLRPPHADVSAVCRHHPGMRGDFFFFFFLCDDGFLIKLSLSCCCFLSVRVGDVLLDGGEHFLRVGQPGHVLRGHVHHVQRRHVPHAAVSLPLHW